MTKWTRFKILRLCLVLSFITQAIQIPSLAITPEQAATLEAEAGSTDVQSELVDIDSLHDSVKGHVLGYGHNASTIKRITDKRTNIEYHFVTPSAGGRVIIAKHASGDVKAHDHRGWREWFNAGYTKAKNYFSEAETAGARVREETEANVPPTGNPTFDSWNDAGAKVRTETTREATPEAFRARDNRDAVYTKQRRASAAASQRDAVRSVSRSGNKIKGVKTNE
jgi:hypothetical protein